MDKGRVQQVGTPREVYESPASRFVADFIGSVNLFDGRVREAMDGRAAVELGDGTLLEAAAGGAAAPGAAVAVALRPEKLTLAAERPDAANALAGTVQAVAYLGDSSVYHVELPSGQVVRASVANAARRGGPAFARGDAVWLGFDADSALVLER
jgi:putrescine transport system ATP-binding protein